MTAAKYSGWDRGWDVLQLVAALISIAELMFQWIMTDSYPSWLYLAAAYALTNGGRQATERLMRLSDEPPRLP